MAETKSPAQQERENEQKEKERQRREREKEKNGQEVDDEDLPEDERNHSLGELEGRLHAAEAHKRLHNQVQKEDYQEQQRREQIAQGPELYEEIKKEYDEEADDQAKREEAMRREDFDRDITKSKAPSSDKTRSDKASDK